MKKLKLLLIFLLMLIPGVCWGAGEVLGNNLVVNGTFDTDTSWTKGTGATIENGVLVLTGVVNSHTYQDINYTKGILYKITFDSVTSTSGSFTLRLDNTYPFPNFSDTGRYTLYWIATSSFGFFGIYGVLAGTIDNIEVREVLSLGNVGVAFK